MSVTAMSSLNIQKEENACHVTGHCEHSGDRVGIRRFLHFHENKNLSKQKHRKNDEILLPSLRANLP